MGRPDIEFFWPLDDNLEVCGPAAEVSWKTRRYIEDYFLAFLPAPGQKGGEELYGHYVTYERHETMPHIALNIM